MSMEEWGMGRIKGRRGKVRVWCRRFVVWRGEVGVLSECVRLVSLYTPKGRLLLF
jgi:hypothetical protein